MTPIDFKMPPGCYASPARAVHHRVSDALKGCDRVAKMVARDGVSRQPVHASRERSFEPANGKSGKGLFMRLDIYFAQILRR